VEKGLAGAFAQVVDLLDNAGRRIYDLYTDFVLKNPFYEVEMPVRCELFDTNLFATVGMLHRRWGVVTG